MHETGDGVEKDLGQAHALFAAAAEQGEDRARLAAIRVSSEQRRLSREDQRDQRASEPAPERPDAQDRPAVSGDPSRRSE